MADYICSYAPNDTYCHNSFHFYCSNTNDLQMLHKGLQDLQKGTRYFKNLLYELWFSVFKKAFFPDFIYLLEFIGKTKSFFVYCRDNGIVDIRCLLCFSAMEVGC